MIAIVAVGVESAGNRIFCSLAAGARCRGVPLLGSDLAGLDDGVAKHHDDEAFDRVWKGEATLAEVARGRPFVTSRSYPCAGAWPDANAFHAECARLGYATWTAVVVRDATAVDRSCALAGHDRDHAEKWAALKRLALGPGVRHRFFDYEAAVQLKGDYVVPWFAGLDPPVAVDPARAGRLVDGNAKHWSAAP